MANDMDSFIPTRRSLLNRLKDWDDQESWRDFFNTYWKLIYRAALKAGLSDAEAQEVVQETVISVAKTMREFQYNPAIGSFKGWLLQLTRWRIADQVRKRPRAIQTGRPPSNAPSRTALIERLPDPAPPDLDALWDQEWERNLMDAALARVKRQISPRQYQIFDCYALKQWPVTRVARTLGVNVAQVYLAKHRITHLIRKEIKALEKKLL
jgi:RNA polymerase sigma-70 factor (ECF subfamily)